LLFGLRLCPQFRKRSSKYLIVAFSILSRSVVPRVARFHFKETFGNGRFGFISICSEGFRFFRSSPNSRPSSSSIQALIRVRATLRIIIVPRASSTRSRTRLPPRKYPPGPVPGKITFSARISSTGAGSISALWMATWLSVFLLRNAALLGGLVKE
jgi:hypothetical protein